MNRTVFLAFVAATLLVFSALHVAAEEIVQAKTLDTHSKHEHVDGNTKRILKANNKSTEVKAASEEREVTQDSSEESQSIKDEERGLGDLKSLIVKSPSLNKLEGVLKKSPDLNKLKSEVGKSSFKLTDRDVQNIRTFAALNMHPTQ